MHECLDVTRDRCPAFPLQSFFLRRIGIPAAAQGHFDLRVLMLFQLTSFPFRDNSRG